MKTFLHVGCGRNRKDNTTAEFAGPGWDELRLDIDESDGPDIVGSMTDMSAVADRSVDAIFSSHTIEHLYAHELPLALSECLRVLKPDGYAILTCPDLQSVAALVADDKLTDVAYVSPAGPVTPLDILFGHRPHLAAGNLGMAHRCGFTRRSLVDALVGSGFASVVSARRMSHFELWSVATKSPVSEADLRGLAVAHFPQRP